MPRQWVANVCATVLKETFSNWVKEQVEKRNEELLVEKGLMIEMDADIAKVFKESTKVSCKWRLPFFFLTPLLTCRTTRCRGTYDEGRCQAPPNQGRGCVVEGRRHAA